MEHVAQKKPLNAGDNPDRVTLGLGVRVGQCLVRVKVGLGLGQCRVAAGEGQVVHVLCHCDILREYVYTAMSFILDRGRLNLGDLA